MAPSGGVAGRAAGSVAGVSETRWLQMGCVVVGSFGAWRSRLSAFRSSLRALSADSSVRFASFM
jgi:hypothetical protein